MFMKTVQVLTFGLFFSLCTTIISAQTLNWNTVEDTKHIVTIGMGWDYSLSYHVGYAHNFSRKLPFVIGANFSAPSGEMLLDDFKAKIGGQIVLLNRSNIKGAVMLNGIYRRFENPLVRLQNFGGELKGSFGYYKSNWFVAGEVGFDKAIVTHFKHSDVFKENNYSEVKDGWYQPATGGNFLYGIQGGYSLKKSDITLHLGKVTTQDLTTTPRIPFYAMLGYNHRIR